METAGAVGLMRGLLALALLALAGCHSSEPPGNAACARGQRWVSAWQAPPTDASIPFDAGLRVLLGGRDQSFRAILSPLGSGSTARVRLSNRFGTAPVSFTAATIARRSSGAGIDAASLRPLLFNGTAGVTLAPGMEVTSDPVSFSVTDFDDIAVSLHVEDAGLVPTHHFMARQVSYATLPLAGDHAADESGAAFLQASTVRPFVVGLDVLADAGTGALVAVGDSLTDGAQAPPLGAPEDSATIDLNQRYPDFLRRRLLAQGRRVFVANAGIAGNQVLQDQSGNSGPSLLTRLDADVLAVAGVTDVLLWEGINDIGQTPGFDVAALTVAYTEVISRLRGAGINVIQGTVTPAGAGHVLSEAARAEVNDWIRTQSPADAIVDFDAAVRDPGRPGNLLREYDGGDGVHFSAAGYQRLADEVDLRTIRGAGCR